MIIATATVVAPAANAKPVSSTAPAPSSMVAPYPSFSTSSSCHVSGGATCGGSSVTASRDTGHIDAVAKVSATTAGSGSSIEQGGLSVQLGLPTSEPQATVAVTFTITDPSTNINTTLSDSPISSMTVAVSGPGCRGCHAVHTFTFCATCDGGYSLNSPATVYLAMTNSKGGPVPSGTYVISITPEASASLNGAAGLAQANLGLTINQMSLS